MSQATAAAGIELVDIHHRYGRTPVLNGLNLQAPAGTITALVGPSGCGKSTALRVIAGLEPATSGSVTVGGRELVGPSTAVPPQQRRVGLVFQDDALFPHRRAWQNVATGLRGLPRQARRERAQAWLERCGVGELAERWPHTCSGGQRARIALARALAPEPLALLLDEPFAGLDPDLRASVRDEVLGVIRETGITCILVTHDPEEALAVADHLALLRGGTVTQAGTPSMVYRHPVDAATMAFFGSISQVAVNVTGNVASTPWGPLPTTGISDGPATLAIRERALSPSSDSRAVAGSVIASRLLGPERRTTIQLAGDSEVVARHRDSGDPCDVIEPRWALDADLCTIFAGSPNH